MSDDEHEDTTIYRVVVNHEEQYSIWPIGRELPAGWREVDKQGPKAECLAYIEQVWTDMRRLSLRKKGGGQQNAYRKLPNASGLCIFCNFEARLDHDALAHSLGFERTRERAHGQPVYRRGNELISADAGPGGLRAGGLRRSELTRADPGPCGACRSAPIGTDRLLERNRGPSRPIAASMTATPSSPVTIDHRPGVMVVAMDKRDADQMCAESAA
ncbi:MAG TPA: MbtH family NRPS accessory protein [Kofleriaceae bacterium]|nr:MbtH family NRPS accessory protein [Kofleriaceae bacterium]